MNIVLDQNEDATKSTTKYLVGVGAGLLVLFVTIWVAGKAWKKSQK